MNRSPRAGCVAEHQLGGEQLVEGGMQLRLGSVVDRGEQRMRELTAERGADLRDLLDRGEAVETGKQRIVQRRRDRERRQWSGKRPVVASVLQKA